MDIAVGSVMYYTLTQDEFNRAASNILGFSYEIAAAEELRDTPFECQASRNESSKAEIDAIARSASGRTLWVPARKILDWLVCNNEIPAGNYLIRAW